MSKLSQTKIFLEDNNIRKSAFLVCLRYYSFRLKYKIGLLVYLENKLYDRKIDHTEFYNHLHSYIHSWKYLKSIKVYGFSKKWFFFHKIHYIFCKFLYPGLDASDYFRYEFYCLPHLKRKTFITEGKVGKLNAHFNPLNETTKSAYSLLDNKAKFNKHFSEWIHREWIDSANSIDELVSFCLQKKVVFYKPLESAAGSGVEKIIFKDEKSAKSFVLNHKNLNYILEEIVVQNKTMSLLNQTSINTIRINSIEYNGQIIITSAAIRFGKESSNVDNYSVGNYVASIDINTGKINSHAVNQKCEQIEKVSSTNTTLLGFQIPKWSEIKELVVKAHKKISNLRYIGWDIAINDKNEPLLIEGNTYAGAELQQHPSLEGKKYLYKKYW